MARAPGRGATPGAVAAALGFSDQAHFTRTFAAIIGLAPEAWRARLGRPAS